VTESRRSATWTTGYYEGQQYKVTLATVGELSDLNRAYGGRPSKWSGTLDSGVEFWTATKNGWDHETYTFGGGNKYRWDTDKWNVIYKVRETPIALDLDASGKIETTSIADSTGRFDLQNNGKPVHSAWIGKGDAWLAADSNGNGVIDDRHELFGGDGPRDAFLKLASYDGNGDGLVDANDPRFQELLVWRDANGDHQSQIEELLTLQAAGVKHLKVKADIDRWFEDAQGVTHGDTATATLINGKEVTLTDLWLPVEAAEGVAPPNLIPSNAAYETLHPYATPLAVLA
jgi:hypothetical protein